MNKYFTITCFGVFFFMCTFSCNTKSIKIVKSEHINMVLDGIYIDDSLFYVVNQVSSFGYDTVVYRSYLSNLDSNVMYSEFDCEINDKIYSQVDTLKRYYNQEKKIIIKRDVRSNTILSIKINSFDSQSEEEFELRLELDSNEKGIKNFYREP